LAQVVTGGTNALQAVREFMRGNDRRPVRSIFFHFFEKIFLKGEKKSHFPGI
jgi:hypothetical protein